MKTFPITDIPEFSNKDRIVVVGVIGKSPYRYSNKTAPLLHNVKTDQNGIECFWDERNSILYLHAVTYLDTRRLAELTSHLEDDNESDEDKFDSEHWLVTTGELAIESCQYMALLFHLCHIVILSGPTPVFDLGYLQLFKAIDHFRNELSAKALDALSESDAGGAWISHGRCCCPRLLFHFQSAPRQLRKNAAALKRLEHAVEDQVYSILRATRIVTNVCAKSLLAIPKNEEFVYISADEEVGRARDVSILIKGLVKMCSGEETTPALDGRLEFRQFLQTHIDLAFGEGFDDNVRKYAIAAASFELPSASSWRSAAQALTPIYLEELSLDEGDTKSGLWHILATDVKFSKARCAKVLPLAMASYNEGLPKHYSSQHHAHKVSVGLGVLETMARGPLAKSAAAKLVAACDATWRSKRLCESLSLTNNVCIKPMHENDDDHSSGVRYINACNCGRKKCNRIDPYTVRRANCTFYSDVAIECGHCHRADVAFPVFQPSTPTFKAAALKGSDGVEELCETRGEDGGTPEAPEGAWSGSPEALSPGSEGASDDDQESTPAATNSPTQKYDLVAVRDDTNTDKGIVRQPSTTEYLPGMLHLDSPPGLLPAFSSWWLVCLGASSLYSHSMGLPEHLQPGFLPHTNYLLPWDCAVRMEQASTWRSVRGRGGVSAGKHHHLTVKIFLGFEYECGRGHRFMMSSPDTVVNGGGSTGGVVVTALGAALAASDMPIYTACPCRGHNTMLAQLQRVHIVTPKAPVSVTLDPKVQPIAGGPTFVPHPAGTPPVRLSGSAYWVLRLPFIYCGERGPLPRPTVPPPSYQQGKIIAPLIGLAD